MSRAPRTAHRAPVLVVLVLVVLAAAVAGLCLGTRTTGLPELLEVCRALAAGTTERLPEGPAQTAVIVSSQRVPRTVLALAAGAAMGLAGTLVQSVTRNPLADPGLLGVNAGAALAVVCATTFLGVTRVADTVWFAFGGAALATAGVLGLARLAAGSGRSDPLIVLLAGTAVSAGLAAAIGMVVLRSPDALAAFRQWTVGSLVGREPTDVPAVLPFLGIGAVLALAVGPGLDALQLGDQVAAGLGSRPELVRVTALVSVTILAGATTAACGPLAFIGLMIPHLARSIAGVGHRFALPVAALTGAAVLCLADVVGRLVARPAELQVGIVLAVLGAPVLWWLAGRVRLA